MAATLLVMAPGDRPLLRRPEGVRRGHHAHGGEGMKIAVIGGGSTYTPELVSGLSRERDRIDVTELALHDIDAERREVVGGMAGRMLGAPGLRRRAARHRRSRPRARRSRLRARPDPRRRPGGAPLGRDDPARVRLHRPGDDGRRRARQGAAHRAGRARDRRRRSAGEPRRMRGSSTSPTRSASSPARCSTRATARSASATSRSGSSASSRRLLGVAPAGVVVDQVGLNHLTWIRSVRVGGADVLPRAPRRARRRARPGGRAAAAAARDARRDPVVLPALLLRARRRARRAARRSAAGGGRGRDRAAAARALPRPDGRREARPARAARRRVLQRGGDRARRLARRRARARCTWSTSATTARWRGSRTTTWSRCRRTIGGGVPVPLPQEPLAPELLGLVQHVAAYERLAVRGRAERRPADVRKALLAHPLIGQWDATDELVDRLLAADARSFRASRLAGSARVSGRLILAVDGGNSKTHLALARAPTARCSRSCAARRARRTTSASTAASSVLEGLLEDAAAERRRRRGGRARARSGCSCSRAWTSRARSRRCTAALAARGWAARTIVGNDTFAVLRAGTDRGWGVAVVCGAGINCVGVAPRRPPGALPGARRDHRRLGRRLRRRARRASAPPRAARTAAARGRRSSRPCRRTSALETPAQLAEAIHSARDPACARVIELAPVVFAEAADDAVAARDRRPPGSRGRRRSRGSRCDAARPHGRDRRGAARRRPVPRRATARLLDAIDRGLRGVGPGDLGPRHRLAADRRRGAARRSTSSVRRRRDGASAPSSARRRRSSELGGDDDVRQGLPGGRVMAEVRFDAGDAHLPGHRRAGRRRARPRRSPTASSWCSSARRAPARRPRCGCSPGSRRSTPARSSSATATSPTSPPKKRDIAMVFQNYALYPYLTVAANIGFPLKIAQGAEGRARGARAARSRSCSG